MARNIDTFVPSVTPVVPDITLRDQRKAATRAKPRAATINEVSDRQERLRKLNLLGANDVIPTTFGKDRFFAKYLIAHSTGDALYVAYLVGDGEIEAIDNVYINGVDVNAAEGFLSQTGTKITTYVGDQSQNNDTDLVGAIGGFSDDYRGTAYLVLKAPKDTTEGIPRVEVEVRGKKIKRYDSASEFEITGASQGTRNLAVHSTDATQWSTNTATAVDQASDVGPFKQVTVSSSSAAGRVLHPDNITGEDTITATFYYKAGTSGRVRFTFKDETAGDNSRVAGVIGSLSVTATTSGALTILSDEDFTTYRATKIKFTPDTFTNNFRVGIGPDTQSGTQDVDVYGMQVESSEAVDDGDDLYTANPVNVVAHLMTEYAGWAVNAESARAAAEWNNDVLPEQSVPRRSVGITFGKPSKLKSVIETLRAYTNCAFVWDSGEIHFIPYRERSSTHTFTADNIESIKLGKKRQSEIPTVVTVQWTDAANDYARRSVTEKAAGVDAGSTPRRIARVNLYGLHDHNQARQEAIERLNTSLSDLTLRIVAYDDGLEVQVGDVITVSHPIGLTSKLMFVTGLQQPEPGIWVIDSEEYDPLLFSAAVETTPTYSDTDLPIHGVPAAITNVSAAEEVFQLANGEWESRIRVVWDATPSVYALGYIVEAVVGGNVVAVQQVPDTQAVITTVEDNVIHTINVRAYTTVFEGLNGTDTITPQGTATAPGAPTSIGGANTTGGDVRLNWGASSTTGIMVYEVRYYTTGQTWADGTVLEQVNGLTFTTKGDIADGTWRFGVKAKNTVGLYSSTAVEIDITVDSTITDVGITTFYETNPPTALAIGDLWYDTNDGYHPYRASAAGAGNWDSIRDETIATAQSAADAAQTDATTALANAATAQADADTAQAAADAAQQDADTAQATADGKVVTYVQSTAPTLGAGDVGDLWIDTDSTPPNVMKIWDGSAWVDPDGVTIASAASAAANAQSTADGKITTFYDPSQPTAEGVGDLWVDTNDDNKLYRWSGSAWQSVRDLTIAAAQSAAATAQQAADDAQADADAAAATADNKVQTFFQAGTPSSTDEGDLWVDTDSSPVNQIKIYKTGSGWVDLESATIASAASAAATAQSTADGKVTTFYQDGPSEPTAEGEGDLWVDTADNNALHRWNGSAWQDARDALIAIAQQAADDAQTDADTAIGLANAAQTDADSAQSTADGKVDTWFSASDPGVKPTGDLWINTGNNQIKIYNGGWVDLDSATIASAASAAATAQTTADGKITTYYQIGIPTAEAEGDLWVDTNDDNKLYRAASAGADQIIAGEWESAQDLTIAAAQAAADAAQAAADAAQADADTAQSTADGKVQTFFQAGTPSSTDEGDLWVDTDSTPVNQIKIYKTGTGWVDLESATIASAASAAATAQTTADGKITTFYQDGPGQPSAEGIGDLWVDTADGNKIYRWSGSAWQSARDTSIATAQAAADAAQADADTATGLANAAQSTADSAQSTADGKVDTWFSASDPGVKPTGDLWVNTVNGQIKIYNGGWQDLDSATIASAASAAATAQTTADGKITTFYMNAVPTSEGIGDLWVDTNDDNKLYRAASAGANQIIAGEWESAQDLGIAAAQSAADAAQAAADAADAVADAAQATADNKVQTFFQAGTPSSTDEGDLWVDTDSSPANQIKIYKTGTGWVDLESATIASAASAAATAQSTADGKITTFYMNAVPTSEAEGDLWVDTNDDNKLYRAASAGANQIAVGEWVSAQDATIATAQATADGKNTIYRQTTAPGGAVEGDLWFDTDDQNKPYRYNGLTWDEVRDAAIADKQEAITVETTPETSAFTAEVWWRYPCDTETVGAFTMTLPVSPTAGDTVYFFDANGYFDVERLTIGRNGKNILGLAEDLEVDVRYFSGGLQYINATEGWVLV